MRKITLYSALSVDGFIAAADGNIDWLHNEAYALEGEDFGYGAFYASIDTTLQGNKTYRQVASFDVPFPYAGKTNYVFSRSSQPAAEHVVFVQEDLVTFVRQLKVQAGGGIWLVGGGQLNGLLLQAGLIDELYLTFIPVALGEGIGLFGKRTMPAQGLQLLEHRVFSNGMINVRYGCR
jgi:dihydrofolate reductase